MVKKGVAEGGDISLGSDAWNVADGYTKIKILRILIQLDRYDTIAQFGTEEFDEDFNRDQNFLNQRRCEAIERFISALRQLLGNVYFALRKEDFAGVNSDLERVKELQKHIPNLYTTKTDEVSKEILFEINEDLFQKILLILQEIKDKINTPLNKAGLIFRPTEEIDLDKIMSEIIDGG